MRQIEKQRPFWGGTGTKNSNFVFETGPFLLKEKMLKPQKKTLKKLFKSIRTPLNLLRASIPLDPL